MTEFEIPAARLTVPELLVHIRLLPEHDPDSLKPLALAYIPAGLPSHSGQTGGFARVVKKYRAYLLAHPDDAGVWEGLGYLHLRMAAGEGTGKGLGAEGLVSAAISDSPVRAGHQLLSFWCELQALLCAPHSIRTRSSLNTSLALALSDAEKSYHRGHYAPIVHALGGVSAAQELRLAIVEELLELHGRSAKPLSLSRETELRRNLALLYHDMEQHKSALILLEQVLALLDQRKAAGEPRHMLGYQSAYLYMHLCALALGDWAQAEAYLNHMEADKQQEDQERIAQGEKPLYDGPATPLRLALLEAQGQHEQAWALAVQHVELRLLRRREVGATDYDWGMVRCASLLHYAGQTQAARELLEAILAAPNDQHTREYAQRTLGELETDGGIHA